MNNVKAYRKKMKLSRKELANRTKLSMSYIYNVEIGKRIPRLSDACKIADALNQSLDDLFPPLILK